MSKSNAMKFINEINELSEVEIMEFDFNPSFKYMKEMERAMKEFVNRVEKGEIRSKATYNKFNDILKFKET